MWRMVVGAGLAFFGLVGSTVALCVLMGWQPDEKLESPGGAIATFLVLFLIPGLLLIRSGWRIHKKRPEDSLDRLGGWIYKGLALPFHLLGAILSLWPSGVTCSNCEKSVRLFAEVGERCPHCGARWTEKRHVRW